jgi:RNA polymerase sigma-70 factor, ECF subfamily
MTEHDRELRFKAWIAEYRGIFHKIARAYAPAARDHEELFHDMVVQLWRSLPGFREQCRPVTWIYRVCLNTALEWRRGQQRRRLARPEDIRRLDEVSADDRGPGWTHAQSELLDQLYAAIHALPPAERTTIVLSLEGLGYREISEITGLKENHVGVVLNRARTRLAESLKKVRHEL